MQGEAPNVAAACRAYEGAAAMGNADAHFNLGSIYGGVFLSLLGSLDPHGMLSEHQERSA